MKDALHGSDGPGGVVYLYTHDYVCCVHQHQLAK
jgi:hypothetical protein